MESFKTKELLRSAIEQIESLFETHQNRYIPIGITAVDEWIVGLPMQGITCLSGHQGVGKTTLTVQVALNHLNNGGRVVWLTRSHTPTEVMMRFVALSSQVDMSLLRKGWLGETEWDGLHDGVGRLADVDLMVCGHDSDEETSWEDVEAVINLSFEDNGDKPMLVIVDDMANDGSFAHQSVSALMDAFNKRMQQHRIALLVLTQGRLEACDASTAIYLKRASDLIIEIVRTPMQPVAMDTDCATLHVLKNNHGLACSISVDFYRHQMRFGDGGMSALATDNLG